MKVNRKVEWFTHFAPDSIREWLSFDASDGEIFRDSNLFSHDSELWFAALNESDLSGVEILSDQKREIESKYTHGKSELDNCQQKDAHRDCSSGWNLMSRDVDMMTTIFHFE